MSPAICNGCSDLRFDICCSPTGEVGRGDNFQLKSLYCEKYVGCIISVKVCMTFIIRVNKMYHTIDIPYCS